MGNCSRLLRWPSRNGLHCESTGGKRQQPCAEEPWKLASLRGPKLEVPRAPCIFARRKERKEAPPTTLSLGTVFITVLPNTFGLRSSAREFKGYYETAQLGAGCAGRVRPFEASYTRSVHSCRWSRAVPGIVTKRSQAQLACFSCAQEL